MITMEATQELDQGKNFGCIYNRAGAHTGRMLTFDSQMHQNSLSMWC